MTDYQERSLLDFQTAFTSDKHLESYLTEFCFRFNRRFWERELFDRLVQACVTTDTITYQEVIMRPRTRRKHLRS